MKTRMFKPAPLALAAIVLVLGGAAYFSRPAPAGAAGGQAGVPAQAASAALSAREGVILAVPPSAADTTLLLTLDNRGAAPALVVGGETPVAAHLMTMQTTKTPRSQTTGTTDPQTAQAGELLGMRPVPFLKVPPGESLSLRADGDHLMLMGLKRPLKVGETLPVTLHLADGGRLSVSAVVTRP